MTKRCKCGKSSRDILCNGIVELLDILQKNKGRLGVRLGDGGLVEQVRAMHEGSLARALPLKEWLAQTDALIDQVVHRLYGLGEDEIKIIERKA